MKLNVTILESKKRLYKQDEKRLQDVIIKHARIGGKLLDVDLMNITVHLNKDWAIETGESGYAIGDDWIQISIDPTRRKNEMKKIIANIIPATIYHEVNHLARTKYIGKDKTLLDAIISEGLANVFAQEQWPKFKVSGTEYSKKQLRHFLKDLKKEKNREKYSYSEWFYGTGKKPRWLGYKFGSYIVHSAKEENHGLTATKMTKIETREIVKLSGIAI